jgi:hypothetical protein
VNFWGNNQPLPSLIKPQYLAILRYISIPVTFNHGEQMNVDNADYKGYRIVASAEHDDTAGLWNGRYRIVDKESIVVYESFAMPVDEESKALEAAHAEAKAWIDSDTAKLSGSPD